MENNEQGRLSTDQADQPDIAPVKEDLDPNIGAKDPNWISPSVPAQELDHHLFTKKYTKVTADNYTFGAYHTFFVDHAQEEEGVDRRSHLAVIHFQEGPIKENGVNGVSNEDLLLMVLTRLNQLNSGPYGCRENSLAITKLEEAVMWLRARTLQREKRQVEGTSEV